MKIPLEKKDIIDIGERLEVYRIHKNLTKAEISILMGYSGSTPEISYDSLLRGTRGYSSNVISNLVKNANDLNLDWLFKGKGNMLGDSFTYFEHSELLDSRNFIKEFIDLRQRVNKLEEGKD